MIYTFDFTTPASTPTTAPLLTRLPLERGVTYRLEIEIPVGSAHHLHLRILQSVHQVWPTNPTATFAGDDSRIMFNDEYYLLEPPFEFQAETWNTDPDYAHRVIIRIGLKKLPFSGFPLAPGPEI